MRKRNVSGVRGTRSSRRTNRRSSRKKRRSSRTKRRKQKGGDGIRGHAIARTRALTGTSDSALNSAVAALSRRRRLESLNSGPKGDARRFPYRSDLTLHDLKEIVLEYTKPIPDGFTKLTNEYDYQFFERCIMKIEWLSETGSGESGPSKNLIDGVYDQAQMPAEIKYTSNYGDDNHLQIHASLNQINALQQGGMILYAGGWRKKQGGQYGLPSVEGIFIIGTIDGSNCKYVKITYSQFQEYFKKSIIHNSSLFK